MGHGTPAPQPRILSARVQCTVKATANRGGELQLGVDQTVPKDPVTESELGPVSGSGVMVSVSDTGEGMPPDALRRLYEPFFTYGWNYEG